MAFTLDHADRAAVSGLTQHDQREMKSALRSGRPDNPNRLALGFQALSKAREKAAKSLGAENFDAIKHRDDDEAHAAFRGAVSDHFRGSMHDSTHREMDKHEGKATGQKPKDVAALRAWAKARR